MRGLYEYAANKSNSYHVYKDPEKCLNGEKFESPFAYTGPVCTSVPCKPVTKVKISSFQKFVWTFVNGSLTFNFTFIKLVTRHDI